MEVFRECFSHTVSLMVYILLKLFFFFAKLLDISVKKCSRKQLLVAQTTLLP